MLADIRAEVGAGVGLNLKYSDAHSIIQRYEELTALKLIKQGNSGDDAPGAIQLIQAVQIQPQQLTFF
ncbi:hypothetical protein D3C77_771810 [compost metagenome]